MQSGRKARWQQATALVSLSTCGAMTGLAFAHGSVADLTSPTSLPVKLMALTKPATSTPASDAALRSAIVRAAQYYLRLAQGQSPAAMEALIWQNDSLDGADHGESCAAFASLMLESGARATGQQSWVTGGTTYPWPVRAWVDSRVDPNPGSPEIISVLQDAQAHQRWHPLGDGYTPQPGDWVLFDGHVEVVTKYSGGVLYTIGGDSGSNLSVNAHEYAGPLAAQGVTGFVNNGTLLSAVSRAPAAANNGGNGAAGNSDPAQSDPAQGEPTAAVDASAPGQADIPGTATSALVLGSTAQSGGQAQQAGQALTAGAAEALSDRAAIPGAAPITGSVTSYSSVPSGPRYSRSQPVASRPASAHPVAGSAAQQAFIEQVAPGALAAQKQYGIPAAVTIAQAIDESGWGQSQLAAQNNNLFGIKGTGPAGSVVRPTQEYENGQFVTVNAQFRAYHDIAQSITDHSLLLATGSSYRQAMADRRSPDAFANALTGIYATDPNYGNSLVTIMRQHNLYRFDAATSTGSGAAAAHGTAAASRPAQGTAAASRAAPGGSGRERTRPGSPQATPQAGAIGLRAAIPGAVSVNAAGLGLPAMAAPGQGGTAVRPAGGHGAAASRAAHGTSARSSVAPSAGARPTGEGASTVGARGAGASGAAARGVGASGAAADSTGTGGARIPGFETSAAPTSRASAAPAARTSAGPAAKASAGPAARTSAGPAARTSPGPAARGSAGTSASAYVHQADGPVLRAGPSNVRISTRRYVTQMPRVVLTDFVTTAKVPLLRAKPIYQDVAANSGVSWELLAACDWMQCQAHPGVSPVYGEPLGAKNPDGTRYRTKSDALEQCAADLLELAAAVYGISLGQRRLLSVRDLANVFAAFRWGSLLKVHRISAMEFPYSVEGLTSQHMKMHWPDIDEEAPDKPGTRFRMPFGAVPVVLGLGYAAIA